MKKLLLVFLISGVSFAQSLSLTSSISIGDNCGNQNQNQYTINGDLNLNGFTLTLRNTNLIVKGNINGSGTINFCGNPNNPSSSVCVDGVIQNNANLSGLTCQTLSNESFTFTYENNGLKYDVFDLQGRLIESGITSDTTFETLPQKTILIFRVNGFKPIKIYKK
jgi:hypothetical protein